MKNKKITWLLALTILAAAILAVIIDRQIRNAIKQNITERKVIIRDTVTDYDTVWLTKTISVDKPTLRFEKVYLTDTVQRLRTDTVVNIRQIHDTIENPLYFKERIFADRIDSVGYKAFVSGYGYGDDSFPRLDSLSFDYAFPKVTEEKIITIDKIITRKKHWNIGIMAGVGYGVVNKKPDVFVGIGGGYSF